MKTYNYSDLSDQALQKLIQRNVDPAEEIRAVVEDIIANVRSQGDKALRDYAGRFDKVELKNLTAGRDELRDLASSILPEQKQALDTAYNNIRKFHEKQLHSEGKVETMQGVTCWRESRPIEKVGLYIPGNSRFTKYLFDAGYTCSYCRLPSNNCLFTATKEWQD